MSSLVSIFEQGILTGLYGSTFDTFSRPITIYKEPIKQALITGSGNPGLFGFGDSQVKTQYTYIPVSGVYPAIVRYNETHRNVSAAEVVDQTNTMTAIGEVVIKVKPDCYAFIELGKTDKFVFDGCEFYFASKAVAMPFLGATFWEYQLKRRS